MTFSKSDSEQLNYNEGTGLYEKLNADGSPMTDAESGQQVAFTNVFVLYASSGIKDDGYTRQYDMTGGTGIYLNGGAWEQISWTKEDATGPFTLTAADGTPLTVAPGKSFIAIWGGYYGQSLTCLLYTSWWWTGYLRPFCRLSAAPSGRAAPQLQAEHVSFHCSFFQFPYRHSSYFCLLYTS